MRPYILYDVNEQKTVLRFKYVHTDEHFDYSHCVPADSANAAKERLDALWEKIQAKRANKKKILEKLLARVGSVAILLVVVLTWFGVKNGVPALFVTSAVLGGGCGWFRRDGLTVLGERGGARGNPGIFFPLPLAFHACVY